jgi:hypothetical protein
MGHGKYHGYVSHNQRVTRSDKKNISWNIASDKSLDLPLLFGWEILTLAAPTAPDSPWPTVGCKFFVQLQLPAHYFF